ncbi:MAG: Gfo/Idh/MocA family protein [Rhodospirillales bacterium]
MINVALIGYGYWGPNLARNFVDCPATALVGVADQSAAKREAAARRYPGIAVTNTADALINDTNVDAVAIATPVATHFPLASAALAAGKHVFVEKPMTDTVESAQTLVDEADRRGLTLMVGHTFIYSSPVRKIQELSGSGALGDILYYDSRRINLGLFQTDVNVVWDLAVHDLAIIESLGLKVEGVSCTGVKHFGQPHENLAFISLFFEGGAVGHLNVSWLSPVKVREVLIGGAKQMVVYDDMEPSNKIFVFDKGVTITKDPAEILQRRVGYRSGDMLAPSLAQIEPLATEVAHFADCIATGKAPMSDGRAGLAVVKTLAAAERSMRNKGSFERTDSA